MRLLAPKIIREARDPPPASALQSFTDMVRRILAGSLVGIALLVTGCSASDATDSGTSEGAVESNTPSGDDAQKLDPNAVLVVSEALRKYVADLLPEVDDHALAFNFSEGLDVRSMANELPITALNARGERLVFVMGTITKGGSPLTPSDLAYGSLAARPEDMQDIGGVGFWAVLKQVERDWALYSTPTEGTLFDSNHDWRKLCSLSDIPRAIVPAQSPARTYPSRAAGPTCPP